MYDEQLVRWADRLSNCILAHQWFDVLSHIRKEMRDECQERVRSILDRAGIQYTELSPSTEDGLALEGSERVLAVAGYDKED